ncbi:MAG: NYN domain-containing protein [Verrucomicrobia bacterium]|nr:NYN domain-containing protein [Kiritimatiellia bacterium]MCP5487916.1 NYN domain-containing protein [Verrucomicrobiota bacterium]
MTRISDAQNLAVFCDFENIALGVKETNQEAFNINNVIERLLLKGNIVVKKAYCDWTRYREFKASMHEASFELIDIPHVRQSGKNSADIRMVVDALDLCYTKEHIDVFVVISGDSDFSPLVSKLRENNKVVIGVGVKKSTSDLLTANCDEFIFYDDLIRKKPKPRTATRGAADKSRSTPKSAGDKAAAPAEGKKQEAFDVVLETYDALVEERGDEDKIWGSMIKQTLKRRKPGFNEAYYGFRTFGQLLEEAAKGGLMTIERDEKSGGYIVLGLHRGG